MIRFMPLFGVLAPLILSVTPVHADEGESPLVFEMGGAAGWGLQQGNSSAGPEVAIEYTVIEHMLEIEVAVSPQFSGGKTEFDTDLIFKKPFDLSDRLEFLIGAGLEWGHGVSGQKPADSIAGEAIAEFVYFPWTDHKVGIFLEQTYSYDFGKEHEQTLGLAAGLHIGIP
jgi:hypothetical protein